MSLGGGGAWGYALRELPPAGAWRPSGGPDGRRGGPAGRLRTHGDRHGLFRLARRATFDAARERVPLGEGAPLQSIDRGIYTLARLLPLFLCSSLGWANGFVQFHFSFFSFVYYSFHFSELGTLFEIYVSKNQLADCLI